MFRSLHRKLVLVFVLLIVSVMAVSGTFLLSSVSQFYRHDFTEQIEDVFQEKDGENPLTGFVALAQGADAPEKLAKRLSYYATALGINSNRFYAILNSDGMYLTGSNHTAGRSLLRTPNIVVAMRGEIGSSSSMAESKMDYAIPIDGQARYILYICDNQSSMKALSNRFFIIIMQAMLFALLVALLLSFLLSKTITTPIENLTELAREVSGGDFTHTLAVQSEDEIGELTSTFNTMAQILKKTIEEMGDERDKLSTVFQHMTDGVAAFTAEGRLIHANLATERLLGRTLQEGMAFGQVFVGMALPYDDDARERGFVRTEIQVLGRTLGVLFAPYGMANGEGGMLAMIHDITEQRKLEEARREFVANVSHELRTPLTNIKSYAETMRTSGDELPPAMTHKFLGVIESEADRMTRIVSDLLTLSKLDYGKMDLVFVRFSVQEMLQKVYTAMELQAQKQGQTLMMELGELPQMVGDAERLAQVVVNILSNAIKYSPSGTEMILSAQKRGERRVQIMVQDHGIGIPKEDIPRLFERFYRVDKARSREKGGTGLGLAIAKEIIEAHKGTIHLDSVEGQGTTVTIILPTNLPMREGTEA